MTDDRWRRLESIFLDGKALSPEERTKLLEERAGEDPDLQAEARALWAEQETEKDFLQSPAARLDVTPHSFSEGQVLAGRFKVVAFLGAGGMGEVYQAVDTRLGRTVAVKVLPRSLIENQAYRARLEKEARALSQLNHAGICALHDLCWEEGQPLLIMERIQGQTLADRIHSGPLSTSEVLPIARQIADALIYSHSHGFIHQDLKPGNIMLTSAGVKLLDFGLARRLSAALTGPMTGDTATAEHTVRGTPGYMSPEQVHGKPADVRSDIFSFGAVLFEMITRRRAFQATSSITAMAAVLHVDPPPVSELAPGTPANLDYLVTRCLRKDPDRRYQHMEEMKRALEELSADAATHSTPASPGSGKARIALWSLPIAAVLAAGIWLANQPWMRPALPPPVVRPFPGDGRIMRYPSFSPDGNQFVYAARGKEPNSVHLFVSLVSGGAPLQLTSGDSEDLSCTWSPDGRLIAFLRQTTETDASLLLISPLGGLPRKLIDLHVYEPGVPNPSNYLSWTPDNKQLIVAERNGRPSPVRLSIVSVDTGEKRTLTNPPQTSIGDFDPAVSPDGRTLAFTHSPALGFAKLHILPLDRAAVSNEVATGFRFVSSPAWLPDGHSLLVRESGSTERHRLWKIDPFGKTPPEHLSFIQDSVGGPFFLSRNHRLGYVRDTQDVDIWKASVEPGKTENAALVTSSYMDSSPRYSADGRKIAFASNRTGNPEIWVCDSQGANPVQLTNLSASSGSPRWSPSGKHLVFDNRRDGNADIYSVVADGGAPRRLTEDKAEDILPSWSHDGEIIYFASNRTGKFQLYRMPSGGGPAIQLTRDGGVSPFESYDRKFIYYAKDRGVKDVWRIPVGGRVEEKLFGPVHYNRFAVTPHEIFHHAYSEKTRHFLIRGFSLSSAVAKIRDVADLGVEPVGSLSALPGGTAFLYTKSGRSSQEFMIVENFR